MLDFLFGNTNNMKRTKAMRVRKLASQVAKLEKKKALDSEEKKLKAKLASLRKGR